MTTNVNLEFLSKVREMNEKMQNLANFWLENQEALEDANVSKDYPFNKSMEGSRFIHFDDLTFDVSKWFLTLFNAYYKTNF